MRRPKKVEPPTRALNDVLAERERQIAKGWTREHDDEHTDGWIANAAADMMMTGQHAIPGTWAWKHKHPDSPDRLERRSQLVVGAAMALAEIERIDRAIARDRDPFPPKPGPSMEEMAAARKRNGGWPR